MRRFGLKTKLEQTPQQVDISPLIDVVFILLIFFIVTSVFIKETGVDIDKPTAISAQNLSNNIVLIAITEQGDVVFDGSNIGVVGVRPLLEQILLAGEKSVVIQADKSVPTALLVEVLDQAKLAGASNVNIATLKA